MEIEQVLHMNGGAGVHSYANNSLLQRKVISKVKPILEESIIELYGTVSPECLKMADLGCSSGPNTLIVASEVVNIINATSRCLHRQPPALQVFLNDLPGNDFNTIFKSIPSFYERLEKEKQGKFGPCFITGVPGSFYGRLFPSNSMHFVHSSYSLHFLSQVPKELVSEGGVAMNKGNIYITKTSPPGVFKAYLDQFQKDFTLFLRTRSEEIIPGGGMVLTTIGSIKSNDPHCIWEFIGLALNDMVLEGLIEEEKLDFFNMPYYQPTANELRNVIQAEGSFTIQRLEIFKMGWDANLNEGKNDILFDKRTRGEFISNYVRAVGEPILKKEFGEAIMDDLFKRFTKKVIDEMETEKCEYINLVISMTKKP